MATITLGGATTPPVLPYDSVTAAFKANDGSFFRDVEPSKATAANSHASDDAVIIRLSDPATRPVPAAALPQKTTDSTPQA